MIEFHHRCPRCHCTLKIADGTRAYQTFDQHVGRPDTPIVERPYKECPNATCPLNTKYFWGMDGAQYRRPTSEK